MSRVFDRALRWAHFSAVALALSSALVGTAQAQFSQNAVTTEASPTPPLAISLIPNRPFTRNVNPYPVDAVLPDLRLQLTPSRRVVVVAAPTERTSKPPPPDAPPPIPRGSPVPGDLDLSVTELETGRRFELLATPRGSVREPAPVVHFIVSRDQRQIQPLTGYLQQPVSHAFLEPGTYSVVATSIADGREWRSTPRSFTVQSAAPPRASWFVFAGGALALAAMGAVLAFRRAPRLPINEAAFHVEVAPATIAYRIVQRPPSVQAPPIAAPRLVLAVRTRAPMYEVRFEPKPGRTP